MSRPVFASWEVFTSTEMAVAAGLSARNFALLTDKGLGPTPVEEVEGRSRHRSYDAFALSYASLVGALNLAGFELLIAGRLAEGFAKRYRLTKGIMPSNLEAYTLRPINPTPGKRPWREREGDDPFELSNIFWLHHRLRNRSDIYLPGIALRGDAIIEIADQAFVFIEHLGIDNVPVFSPASGTLPVSPEFRITGRGGTAQIVAIEDELPSLDFSVRPDAVAKLKEIEATYLSARENAVSRVKINLSLAIRNGLDRLQDERVRRGREIEAA